MKLFNKLSISLLALSLTCGSAILISQKTENDEFLAAFAEEELITNEFLRIAGGWNPNQTLLDSGLCSYVLEFKNNWKSDGSKDNANLLDQIGDRFTLNGTPFSSFGDSNFDLNLKHGGKYFNIIIPTSYLTPADGSDKCIIQVEDDTPFYDLALPEMTLSIELETYEMAVTAKKVTSVDFRGLVWNKENKDPSVFGEKKGLLIGLGQSVYDGTSGNLLEYTIAKNITLNGTPFKDLPNAEVRIYNSKLLWLYADNLNTVSSDANVLKMGTTKFNGNTLGGFNYYLSKRDGALWNSYQDVTSPKTLELYYDSGTNTHGSAWPSNKVFENNPQGSWFCGGTYKEGKAGYLLSFSGPISDTHSIYAGSHKYVNLAHEEAGHHFYSNGVPLCDIDGAELQYVQEGHIWIWTPNIYEPYAGKNYAKLTVDSFQFFDTKLPSLNVYHEDCKDLAKYDSANLWHVEGYDNYTIPNDRNEEYMELDQFTSSDDSWLGPYSWNNHDGDGTTIIAYGHNSADEKAHDDDPTLPTTYLNKDKNGNCVVSKFNMSIDTFSIGYKLKLNGIPFCKIPESQINYQNGENFFTFILKEKYCVAFNGYKVPTITLEDGANFFGVSLQGFSIYFSEGKWHKTSPETVSDSSLEEAAKYSDVFDVSEFDDNVNETSATLKDNNNAFALEFRTESLNAIFALNLFGSSSDTGLQVLVDFHNSSISAYDDSNLVLSGDKPVRLDVCEWTRLYVKVERLGSTANIVIALDDVAIAKIDGFVLSSTSNYGNHMSIYTNDEKISFRDPLIGKYIKSPDLQYSGKETYRFYVGDEFPDLTPYLSASDLLENVKDKIVIDIPNNMLDDSNRLNKGTFIVEAYVINSSGSKKSQFITVIVTEANEAVVTFDGENPQVYKLGEKINKPVTNPTKEGESNVSYEFLYWANNGVEWDFDNDYVTQDINLTSTFKEVIGECCVTFETTGLKENKSFSMFFISGAVVTSSMFEKEGYTLKMYVNNEEVTSFTVSGDMNVKLEYTKTDAGPEKKKGCGGSIMATSIITSIISILGVTLVVAKRKEDK